MNAAPALALSNLAVAFDTPAGPVVAVHGADLDVHAGQCVAVVGESGSGKTQLFLGCLGLLAANGRANGSARLLGQELIGAGEERLRSLRGAKIATVFQDPMNALTPHLRVGSQIAEMLTVHQGLSISDALRRAVDALRHVGIADAERRAAQFPHEFSGGMRQRVAIAMALIAGPAVLIADEPTTALDVTVQSQVLALLRSAVDDGLGLVLISHDLAAVAGVADRIAVMYGGRIVETGSTEEICSRPQHPYTQALLGAVPRLDSVRGGRLETIAGRPPAPGCLPDGCSFEPRCPRRIERCRTEAPASQPTASGAAACHLLEAREPA